MSRFVHDVKSCDPQLLEVESPSHTWPLERLRAIAHEEHVAILAEERSTTSRYWRLGQVLHLARKQFAHGHWDRYLKELGIEKTRAVKAMRIFETFSTPAQTQHLTVVEAYAQRKRRPRTVKAERVSATEAQEALAARTVATRTWSQFATAIIAEVERQQDETEFMAATEIRPALAEVARAVSALRHLEERLQSRNSQLNDAATADAMS